MTNIDRQKSLDKQKWLMSEEVGEDLSGEMLYCEFCNSSINKKCKSTQQERVANSLCATAFNRMKRVK